MHFYGSASAEPFLLSVFRRTGGHDCASPAVAPQGASRRRLLILAQASRGVQRTPSDAPQFSKCNGDDRSQRLKQGGAVGAAASKTRAPLKVRSGCWEPQPGGTFPTALLRQSRFCCLRSTERSIQQSAPTPVLERGRFVCEGLQPESCKRNRRLGHISQSDPAQSVRRCKAGRHRFVKGGKARLSALRFCRAGWRTRQ